MIKYDFLTALHNFLTLGYDQMNAKDRIQTCLMPLKSGFRQKQNLM